MDSTLLLRLALPSVPFSVFFCSKPILYYIRYLSILYEFSLCSLLDGELDCERMLAVQFIERLKVTNTKPKGFQSNTLSFLLYQHY